MTTLSCLFRYIIAFLLLVPFYISALFIGIISRRAAWRIIVCWNRLFLKLFEIEVSIDLGGQEISQFSGGVVIGLNQESLLDPIIGQVASPLIFKSIWNIEYTFIPLVGWVTPYFGWVIIRQWPKQAKQQLDKAVSYVQKGGFLFISIEDKRSKDGTLGLYKKGPVVMAIQAQTHIIPVVIRDSRRCLPYGDWKILPGKVTLKFFDAIPTKGMCYEDRNVLVDRLRRLAEHEVKIESAI